jgi:hypothetical protein
MTDESMAFFDLLQKRGGGDFFLEGAGQGGAAVADGRNREHNHDRVNYLWTVMRSRMSNRLLGRQSE